MATIHVSEAEAASDFPGLLARVRAGAEVIIDMDASYPVVVRVAAEVLPRKLSDSLSTARQYSSTATLDVGFAADPDAVSTSHPEALGSSWD